MENRKSMTKFLWAVFAVCLVVCAVLCLGGCTETSSKPPQTQGPSDTQGGVEQPSGSSVTITFDVRGGETVKAFVGDKGDALTLPVPVREGYDFMGWYTSTMFESSERFVAAEMPATSITLYAKWEKQPEKYENDYLSATAFTVWTPSIWEGVKVGEKLTIRWTTDDHANGSEYNLNTNVEAKSGYNIFWFSDEDCTHMIGTQRAKINYGDNVFYATVNRADNGQYVEKYAVNVYLRHDYTYTYLPYSPDYALTAGIGAFATQRVIEDNVSAAPTTTPQNGYTFVKWVTADADGQYVTYDHNTRATKSRTFYAVYAEETLTVDIGEEARLVNGTGTSVSFVPYSTNSIPPIPAVSGRVFDGYYIGDTQYIDEDGILLRTIAKAQLTQLTAVYVNDTQDKYFTFTYAEDTSDYAIALKKAPTYAPEVILPDTYEGKAVNRLTKGGFGGYGGHLVLNNRITSIALECFYRTALTGVTIPANVLEIAASAFDGSQSLKKVIIKGNPSMNAASFTNCDHITYLEIPASKISLFTKAELQTLVVNSGTTLAADACKDCTALEAVYLSDSMTTLHCSAFTGCTALTKDHIYFDGVLADIRVHAEDTSVPGVVTEPTCVDGYTTYQCICGEYYQADFVTGSGIHTPSGAGTITAPKCAEHGYTAYHCSVCKQDYQDDFVAALGHEWDDSGKKCTVCGEEREYVRVDANGNKSDTGDYILFGSYPQTEVTNSSLTSTLTSKAGTKPTSSNAYAWTSYGYYVNGSVSNYMWYQDIEYNGETYRGVYFTSYRSYYTGNSNSTDYTYQDDNGYYTSNIYWFKFEPILWRIVAETNGEATLVCEMLIDSQEFDGGSNNYAYSNIRAWLNDSFYETAFNELERELILLTTVDNSVASTGYSSNQYACENTQDYIYLLSYKEVMTYFTSNADGQKQTTDYAQCQGARTSTSSSYAGNGYWWLRSPRNYGSYLARGVDSAAYMDYHYVYDAYYGVCPALRICL